MRDLYDCNGIQLQDGDKVSIGTETFELRWENGEWFIIDEEGTGAIITTKRTNLKYKGE